jgi:hypothetical protein
MAPRGRDCYVSPLSVETLYAVCAPEQTQHWPGLRRGDLLRMLGGPGLTDPGVPFMHGATCSTFEVL